MMRSRRATLSVVARLAVAVVLALAAFGIPAADAADLDAAKRGGLVGERSDGFLGLVGGNVPADVRAMVNTINAERRTAYQDIATKTGASVQEVGSLAGRRLIGSAPPGTYVMPSGQWVRK